MRPRRTELARQRAAELAKTVEELEAERGCAVAEVAAAKKAADGHAGRGHDWSEAETREFKIDALLAEAGWTLTETARPRVRGRTGCPRSQGVGYVDYVLWGDDGLPLAVVEAKKHAGVAAGRPAAGQALRRLPGGDDSGQRPVIFYIQRLRALALGRHAVPAPASAGLLHQGRAGAADPAAHDPRPLADARHRRQRSSSATTSTAPSARSASTSRPTSSARRCW